MIVKIQPTILLQTLCESKIKTQVILKSADNIVEDFVWHSSPSLDMNPSRGMYCASRGRL